MVRQRGRQAYATPSAPCERAGSARAWERFTFEGVEGLVWAEVVPLPSEYLRHGNARWAAEKQREVERASLFAIGSVFQFVGSLSVLVGW